MSWSKAHWLRVVSMVVCGLIGAAVGRLLPPFVLDQEFWRTFWVSPAVGGLAVVLAALIAFGAARQSARVSIRSAQRQEWWYRAEWALNMAVADEGKSRDTGIRVLEVLIEDATETEAQIIAAVTGIYFMSSDGADVDGLPD